MNFTNLGKIVLFSIIYSVLALSSGFAAVNITVEPSASIPVDQTCEMDVTATGDDMVAGAQIRVLFDPSLLKLQDINVGDNVWTNDTAAANTSNCLTIVYLAPDGGGLNADADPVFATLTFKSLTEGQTKVRIGESSIVSNSQSQSVAGVFTGAEVKSQTPQSVAGAVTFSMAGLTDLPLENATVTIDGGRQAFTDGNGQFSLENVPPGDHALCINAEAFEETCVDFYLSAGGIFDAGTMTLAVTEDCTEEIQNAVTAERSRWDANIDDKKGLPEAIDALQTVAGIKGPK